MKNQAAITGSTKIVGLLGWPVSHSLSPAMHNAAFDYLGLDWRYVPLPVDVKTPEMIPNALLGLRALGLHGANVTVPHKQAVMPCVDRLEPAAQAIGAVNTLVVEKNGWLLGDNTDAAGFCAICMTMAWNCRIGMCWCWALADLPAPSSMAWHTQTQQVSPSPIAPLRRHRRSSARCSRLRQIVG